MTYRTQAERVPEPPTDPVFCTAGPHGHILLCETHQGHGRVCPRTAECGLVCLLCRGRIKRSDLPDLSPSGGRSFALRAHDVLAGLASLVVDLLPGR